jgi:hypothetical protein
MVNTEHYVLLAGNPEHACNIANPSFEKVMFVAVLKQHGFGAAIFLGAKSRWKCQRPLRAAMTARGENSTALTAKRCSPASRKGQGDHAIGGGQNLCRRTVW